MQDHDGLAERFEEHRPRLRGVAHRMLGMSGDADDAVQEAWIRLSRADVGAIDNLGGWLTTVVSRVSLDMLRGRASRREDPVGTGPSAMDEPHAIGGDPEAEAALAASVGEALLLVLDTLSPSERLAFVLHDIFAVPFDQVGVILDRSPNAAKQLASRARQRVRAAGPDPAADPLRQHEVVGAFLAASRGGEFDALLELLDPDIVLTADAAAVAMGSPARLVGAPAVAGTFSGRAQGAQPALIAGRVGIVWMVGGRPKVAWTCRFGEGTVAEMEMIASAERLEALEVIPL